MEPDSRTLISIASLLFGFLILYTFFTIAAIAIRRSSISRVEELEQQGVLFANKAKTILNNEDSYILRCQLGQLIVGASFGWLLFSLYHQNKLQFLVGNGSAGLLTPFVGTYALIVSGVAVILVVAIITLILIQLGKSIVGTHPEKSLFYLSLPVIYLCKVILPISIPVSLISKRLMSLFKMQEVQERNLVKSTEDITQILEHSSEAGEIDEEEREMIEGIFIFSETIVQEVMTPRKDIVYISEDRSLSDIVKAFQDSGFSRLLVCGEDLDDVKGVVLAKDLIPYVGKVMDKVPLEGLIRRPFFCAFNKKVDILLQELRANAVHLAVVKDEHGGVAGIVTLEDLVEEIVGDILDEFDIGDEEQVVRVLDNGDLLVDGGISIYDLGHDYNITLPEGEYNTLAGFLIHLIGRIPNKGEIISHEGHSLRIEKISQNRIKLVRVIKSAKSLTRLSLVKDGKVESEPGLTASKGWDKSAIKPLEKLNRQKN